MPKSNEITERELMALDVAQDAIRRVMTDRVHLTYVRGFRAGKVQNVRFLELCTVRFAFAVRRDDTEEYTTGTAEVRMVHHLASDTKKLAHHYFVWMPEIVALSFTTGTELVLYRGGTIADARTIGNREYKWFITVAINPKPSGRKSR